MKYFFIDNIFIGDAWKKNVAITVDATGFIQQVIPDSTAPVNCEHIKGLVIPSMPNLHSHAFQRAMAGLAEIAQNPRDSFWSWRKQMYGLVSSLTPEQIKDIASFLYVDMLKGGYTQVAEFNYLHHDFDGSPYHDDQMSQQLRAAAQQTGIGQTLLPVLYSHSGFGEQPPLAQQKRFIQTSGQYIDQLEALRSCPGDLLNTGICFHSLRAVTVRQMSAVLDQFPDDLPVHIHVAEQMKEVDDCLAWSGRRPVAYLYNEIPVDSRWCLVHSTHLTGEETGLIAQSGAVAGICPTTEANLGDGIFPAVPFIQQHGSWGIGSDSHVSLNALEELRWLEYGQRLIHQKRNRLMGAKHPSVGDFLWRQAAAGGARACGVKMGKIAPGYRADWLELHHDEWFSWLPPAHWINRWLFAGDKNKIENVYVAGKKVIEQGYHPLDHEVSERFNRVMKALGESIVL